jgi:hypothetical protein
LLLALGAPTQLGCSCRDERASSASSGGRAAAASAAEALPHFALHAATAAGARPVLVALSRGPELCEAARAASGGEAHLVCGRGHGAPAAGALRAALRKLKAGRGEGVRGGSVTVLATDDHASTLRLLASQDPAFFARLAVWAGPLAQAHLGATFVDNVGSRGAAGLVYVGRTPEELAPLARQAGRSALELHGLAGPPGATPDAATVGRVLSILAGVGQGPNDAAQPRPTDRPASAPEQALPAAVPRPADGAPDPPRAR